MSEEFPPSRKAQIVRRACREMGLFAVWEPSRLSESEYVTVWHDIDEFHRSAMKQVRFSDHMLPDQYRGKGSSDYFEYTFEVACTVGHEEVNGDCYQAIEWIAEAFGRTVPLWVPRKISIAA